MPAPKSERTRDKGTFPGRKPLIFTVLAVRFKRASNCSLIRLVGTETFKRRATPETASVVTCMASSIIWLGSNIFKVPHYMTTLPIYKTDHEIATFLFIFKVKLAEIDLMKRSNQICGIFTAQLALDHHFIVMNWIAERKSQRIYLNDVKSFSHYY